MPPQTSSSPDLSEEQLQVLALLAQGLTNKEIAAKIGRSKNIVDKMLSNGPGYYAIYPRIGVSNGKAAVAWYLQHCLAASSLTDAPMAPGVVSGDIPATHRSGPLSPFLIALLTIYFCLFFLTFVPIWLRSSSSPQETLWANALALIPALAGAFGLFKVRSGANLDRGERRAWALLCVSLLGWSLGALFDAMYAGRTGAEPPYPSVGDLGYFAQTLCQTLAFSLWWLLSYRRRGQNKWLWPLSTAALTAVYLAVQFTVRDPKGDLTAQPLRLLLDALYALGDSASVVAALLIVMPRAVRLWERPVRRSMLFLAAGMVAMCLSGWIFVTTASLPDAHPLKFVRGNVIDFGFATAFLLMGVAIGLLPTAAPRD